MSAFIIIRNYTHRRRQGQPHAVQMCSSFPGNNTLCLTNSKIVYCLVRLFFVLFFCCCCCCCSFIYLLLLLLLFLSCSLPTFGGGVLGWFLIPPPPPLFFSNGCFVGFVFCFFAVCLLVLGGGGRDWSFVFSTSVARRPI